MIRGFAVSIPYFDFLFDRPPLPKFVAEELLKRVPNAVLATNPCRLQYCTQEIVVIREDLVTKMCRNNIHFPSEGEIPDHVRQFHEIFHFFVCGLILLFKFIMLICFTFQFARTIISQAHLAPLPLSVCPVYWTMDAALQIYPLPDLIVTADKFNSFATSHMECQVMNPVSFNINN